MATTSKFRADHVGSLLRPPELLKARIDYFAGAIPREALREVEEACILRAIDLQRAVGIDIFTEGEYRRSGWSGAVRDSVEGLVPAAGTPLRTILGEWRGPAIGQENPNAAALGPAMVAGEKLRQVRRLAGDEAAFLKQHAPGPWKITMPGAMSAHGQLYEPGTTDRVYPSRVDLARDIVVMLQNEVKALIEDGVSYIQLDSLHYVERVADTTIRPKMEESGEDPDAYLDTLIELDNAVLDVAKAGGVTVGLHMCRGNSRSGWHAEGSYEPIAERAFQKLNVDRFLLEYDTERAGGFEPLRFVPKNKMVVLGIISSKLAAPESVDDLRRRIDEATKYVPLENLAISPQCGFASNAPGNLLTWDEQRRKLELVVETARKVWT